MLQPLVPWGTPRWEEIALPTRVSTCNLLETWLQDEMPGIVKKCLHSEPDLPPHVPTQHQLSFLWRCPSSSTQQPRKLMKTAGVCPGLFRVNSQFPSHAARGEDSGLPLTQSRLSPPVRVPTRTGCGMLRTKANGATSSLPVDPVLQLLIS